jgi:hypothetical protein
MTTSVWSSDLTLEHTQLLDESRAGIERLVARMQGPKDGIIFLVADVDSALGAVILGLGVPRHPKRRSVVMPLTREDAIRAAGSLMGPSLVQKLDAYPGAAVLVMVGDSARLVPLDTEPPAPA